MISTPFDLNCRPCFVQLAMAFRICGRVSLAGSKTFPVLHKGREADWEMVYAAAVRLALENYYVDECNI